MRKKILISLLIGTAISGFGDLAMAKPGGKAGGKVKKTFCDGKEINIKGTNKSDTIIIIDETTATVNGETVTFLPPAVVSGGNGNDTITGSEFDDTICGGNGQDTIYGMDGDDNIFGQNGKDTLYGDDEESSCVPVDLNGPDGVPGTTDDIDPNGPDGLPDTGDEVAPVSCDDTIEGGNAKDIIEGGDGDDTLIGGNAPDEIHGGLGSDSIDGGKGKDTCTYAEPGDVVDPEDQAEEDTDSADNDCEK